MSNNTTSITIQHVRDIILEVNAEHVKSSLGITDGTDSQLTDMIVKEVMVRVQSGGLLLHETLTELINAYINKLLPLSSRSCFKDALGITDVTDSQLTDMIVKETMVRVQSGVLPLDEILTELINYYINKVLPLTSRSGPESEKQKTETLKKKMAVKLFVEILVKRTLRKSKVNFNIMDISDIILRLFETTWILVEKVKFDITQKTFKHLEKIIFKDLCKNWGSPEMVLLSMAIGDPEIGNCIAFAIRHHLTTGPKKGCISRFFSSVGCAFNTALDSWRAWEMPLCVHIFLFGMMQLLFVIPVIIYMFSGMGLSMSGSGNGTYVVSKIVRICRAIRVVCSRYREYRFGYGSFRDMYTWYFPGPHAM